MSRVSKIGKNAVAIWDDEKTPAPLNTIKAEVDRLRDITSDCRPDMHEPDEQGISAVVFGNHLDNAMGNDPTRNHGEFLVGITRDGCQTEWFNLATLIAMARAADKRLLP